MSDNGSTTPVDLVDQLNGVGTPTPATDTIRALINGGIADGTAEVLVERDRLRAELNLATGERERLLERVEEIRAESAQHKAEKDELQTLNNNQGINIGAYQEQVAALASTVEQKDILANSLLERVTRMQTRVGELQDELTASRTNLDHFKARVVTLASEAADEHGWCGEIDRILSQLDLEREPVKFQATVQITVNIAARRDDGNRGIPDEDWVYGCLEASDLEQAIRNGFRMDSDVQDERIFENEIAATETEEDND